MVNIHVNFTLTFCCTNLFVKRMLWPLAPLLWLVWTASHVRRVSYDSMIIAGAFIILFLCCICILYFGNNLKRPRMIGPVLIVTAHPDDECMFFSPVILALTKWKVPVDLLCLSCGDFYGMGRVRSEELKASVNVLGIRHMKIINDDQLPDDPNKSWPASAVLDYVGRAAQKWKSKTIVTFDGKGVSGHSNHCQIYHALCSPTPELKMLRRYALKTHYVGMKYFTILTIIITSLFERGNVLCSPLSGIFLPQKAMFQHRSQLVWFRYIYIVFSSYMFVNVLAPLNAKRMWRIALLTFLLLLFYVCLVRELML